MYLTRLRADKMAALKAKDTTKNKVVTMLVSAITYKHKELGRDLTEAECLDVIGKELKQVRESQEMSKSRPEVVEELQQEIAILESYLPKQMDGEELQAAVAGALASAGIEISVKNKGMMMKTVMAELKGKADGKAIGAAVDAVIAANA